MSQTCKECGSRCCTYFCFEIDRPTSFEVYENYRWFLMHKDVTIHIDFDGDWYIGITNRCNNLREDGLCSDYENRPIICRRYNTEACDFTQGDYEYKAMFRTPQELENYARSKIGKRYDAIRARTYERLARPAGKPSVKKKSGGKGGGKGGVKAKLTQAPPKARQRKVKPKPELSGLTA